MFFFRRRSESRRRHKSGRDRSVWLFHVDSGDLRPGSSRQRPQDGVRYVVQLGDELSDLAARFYGDEKQWQPIYDANRHAFGHDGQLWPGQELLIPPHPVTGAIRRQEDAPEDPPVGHPDRGKGDH